MRELLGRRQVRECHETPLEQDRSVLEQRQGALHVAPYLDGLVGKVAIKRARESELIGTRSDGATRRQVSPCDCRERPELLVVEGLETCNVRRASAQRQEPSAAREQQPDHAQASLQEAAPGRVGRASGHAAQHTAGRPARGSLA